LRTCRRAFFSRHYFRHYFILLIYAAFAILRCFAFSLDRCHAARELMLDEPAMPCCPPMAITPPDISRFFRRFDYCLITLMALRLLRCASCRLFCRYAPYDDATPGCP